MTNDSIKKTPDPAAAMLFFFIVTSIYCLLGIFMGGGDPKTKVIVKICYILFVIIGEYFINLNLTNSMCGVNQWRSTFMITLIPWLIIFGVLHLCLELFPGWMSPFSNTFGYLAAKLMGLPDLMKEILVPAAAGETQRAILSVASDDSILINQFSPESAIEVPSETAGQPGGVPLKKIRPIFDEAWKKLQAAGIIKQDNQFPRGLKEAEKKRNELYKFVDMKFTISEYVWNMLTGFLVTSVSYNYILNTGCQKSAIQIKQQHDDYEAAQKKKKANKQKREENDPNYVQST
jgi:hypothetical protein